MVRGMNRAVPIALLSLFVTCFVGSLAAGSLALIGAVREAANTLEPLTDDRPAPPDDEALSSEPGPASDPTPAVDATPAVTPEAVPWQAPVLATGQFAVFHVGKAKVDGWKALQKALKGTKLAAYDDEAPDEAEPPYLVFHALPVDDYAVITGEALDTAWGLSTPQKTQLRGAQSASVIDFVLPLHDASLLEVTKVAAALADATGGVLWDEECQEYFSPAQWRMRRVASWDKTVPQVSLLSVLRESEDGALRTAGLSHLGLPDLRLSHVSPEAREQALNFLQLAAQQLAEARVPVEPGITMIRLEGVKHRRARAVFDPLFGDDANKTVLVELEEPTDGSQVLELDFKGTGTPTQRTSAGLANFFGTP